MANKDVKALKKKLARQGWTIEKGKKYDYARPPSGRGRVRIPNTPSSSRWLKNIKAELKRHGYEERGPHG